MKNSSGQLHVVLGNEACDLDSMVSALTFAYFLSKVRTLVIYSLTALFVRKICAPAHSCKYLIRQSCVSSAMYTVMQIVKAALGNVHNNHQNGGKT